MIKKYLMLLVVFIVLNFTLYNVWADIMKEPKIIKINDSVLVYDNVAEVIVKKIETNNILEKNDTSLKIYPNDPFFKKIIMLYKQAREKAPTSDKRKFWVFCCEEDKDSEIGIFFDKDKNLIDAIIVD